MELLGDAYDSGHYGGRHDDTNRAWHSAAAAVSTGSVVLCDKGKRTDGAARAAAQRRYSYLNDGHIPDHARPRQGKGGTHIVNEVKVVSPHTQHTANQGRGNVRSGGGCLFVGHLYAFGSTLESYRKMVFGVRGHGSEGEAPLDHTTGEGWVREHAGHYADALQRGSTVNLLLHELYGGMTGPAFAYLVGLAKLSRRRGGRDDTAYHDPPGSKRLSFLEHHSRAISSAVLFGDASRIAAMLTRASEWLAPSPPNAGVN